jgi:Mrp family chromosome partitioning ATPase
VANAFARDFIVYQQTTNKSLLEVARQVLDKQIGSMSTTDLASTRGQSLVQRLEELGIIEQMQTGGFLVSERALAPESPFSPQPVRNAVLALVVGLILGLGLAFLLEYLDRRIKDEQTLEKVFGLPVLATVPMVGGSWRERRKGHSDLPIGFADKHSPLLESFRTLRSNLQYFGVDKEIRTILVTSPLPREGKSTVSINLALGLALSGARVIVLEADLRRPMLHTYLKLGNEVGISNVLAGTHTFAEAMQLVRVDDYMPEDARRRMSSGSAEGLLLQKNLYCLTSGPFPPNPAELVGSLKMQELLQSAAESADYVIVDSPPLLLAADAVTLAALVDGVLLTARLFSTTRDEAQAARELLERVGARVIGAVASGGRLSQSYYRGGYQKGYRYGYGYGYGVREAAEASSGEK